jgi:acyl-CoA thioesterase YciA
VTAFPEEILAIRVTAMPRDTNAHGTIFGGYILSLIDQAGAIAGHGLGAGTLVTVAMDKVEFKAPVHVGDLVTCWSKIVRVGKSSVVACVRVVAQSPTALARGERERDVTQAEVVYVNLGEDGRPKPLRP